MNVRSAGILIKIRHDSFNPCWLIPAIMVGKGYEIIVSHCIVLVLFALTIIVEPAMAQPDMSIPFITTPWFVSARPAHLASLIIIETNASHLADER